MVPLDTGRYVITNRKYRNASHEMCILRTVLTVVCQVPILPDANDQTDIVAGTQEGEPGELVRCVLMQVNP